MPSQALTEQTQPAGTSSFPPFQNDEILTPTELADMLKMSVSQVYSLTRSRASVRHDHPLPVLRINGNLRFRRASVLAWLSQIEQSGGVQ